MKAVNNQDPLKRIVLSQIGTESQSSIKGRSSSTSTHYMFPERWKPCENGYISKLSHSGELQWRKQIADVDQITTATDKDEKIYAAWSRNMISPRKPEVPLLPS